MTIKRKLQPSPRFLEEGERQSSILFLNGRGVITLFTYLARKGITTSSARGREEANSSTCSQWGEVTILFTYLIREDMITSSTLLGGRWVASSITYLNGRGLASFFTYPNSRWTSSKNSGGGGYSLSNKISEEGDHAPSIKKKWMRLPLPFL